MLFPASDTTTLGPPVGLGDFREWITVWFAWLGARTQAIGDNFLTWARNLVVGYRRIFDTWEESVIGGIDWWLDWAPWPISILTDWLGGCLKSGIIQPIFTLLKAPCIYVREQIDYQWDDDGRDYAPSLTLALRCRELGETILIVYDQLIYYTVSTVQWLQDGLDLVLTSVWTSITSIDADLLALDFWVRHSIVDDLNDLTRVYLGVVLYLDQVYNDLYPITQDPAGWVWRYVYPVLTTKIRQWLLDIW